MNPWDVEDGDFLFCSGNVAYDSDGHMMVHTSGNMAIDMDTGEYHMVLGWDDDDEDE